MLNNPSKGLHFFFFMFALITLVWYYDFGRLAFMGPQSTHYWRQADGASITLNYFQDGFDFWKPRIHNSTEAVNSYVVGEFPILYYLAALFYPIFGEQEWILKTITFSFFALGLFSFSRLLWHLTRDFFTAFTFPFLLTASPILMFYTFNYLPNIPALSLVIIGLLCFYHYKQTQKTSWFYAVNSLFLLAGLLKPTVLVTWVAIGGLWFFDIFLHNEKVRKLWVVQKFQTPNIEELKPKRIFSKPYSLIPAFLMVLVVAVAWQLWVAGFSTKHGNKGYFLQSTLSIWTIKAQDRWNLWLNIKDLHCPRLFWEWTHYVIMGIALFCTFTYKKQEKWLFWLMVMTFLGIVAYVLLWFPQFYVHDYYTIDCFIVPVLILLCCASYLKKHTSVLKNPLYKISITLFLFWNIFYCQNKLKQAYDLNGEAIRNWSFSRYNTLDLRAKIRDLGIQPSDAIITIPDISPNTSLYYYNCRGYSGWNLAAHVLDYYWVTFYGERKGCKYLIINDLQHKSLDTLRPYLPPPMAVIDSTFFIYDYKTMIQNKANDPSVQKVERNEN
jgi:Dolichyl-phosphate-mannose-protein mannosyltransferase